MAPPNRTQKAADALLNTASLGSRSIASAKAQSTSTKISIVKNKKVHHTTNYTTQLTTNATSNTNSSTDTMKKKGIKRPLANLRGKNDSITAVNSNNTANDEGASQKKLAKLQSDNEELKRRLAAMEQSANNHKQSAESIHATSKPTNKLICNKNTASISTNNNVKPVVYTEEFKKAVAKSKIIFSPSPPKIGINKHPRRSMVSGVSGKEGSNNNEGSIIIKRPVGIKRSLSQSTYDSLSGKLSQSKTVVTSAAAGGATTKEESTSNKMSATNSNKVAAPTKSSVPTKATKSAPSAKATTASTKSTSTAKHVRKATYTKKTTVKKSSAFDKRNSRDRISKKEAPMSGTDKQLLAMLDAKKSSSSSTAVVKKHSAFDKRNSRDRISKKEAPMSGTDKQLLAMLDGPSKNRRPRQAVGSGSGARDVKRDVGRDVGRDGVPRASASIGIGGKRTNNSTTGQRNNIVNNSNSGTIKRPRINSPNNEIIQTVIQPPKMAVYSTNKTFKNSNVNKSTEDVNKLLKKKGRKRVKVLNGSTKDWQMYTTGGVGGGVGKNDFEEMGKDEDLEVVEDKGTGSGTLTTNQAGSTTSHPTSKPSSSIAATTSALSKEVTLAASTKEESSSSMLSLGIGAKKRINKKSRGSAFSSSSSSSGNGRLKKGGYINDQPSSIAMSSEESSKLDESSKIDEAGAAESSSQTADMPQLEMNGDTTLTALETESLHTKLIYDDEDMTTAKDIKTSTNYAEWYDPEEFAAMEKEAAAEIAMTKNDNEMNNDEADLAQTRGGGKKNKKKSKKNTNVNENFVRLDLRNAAGSCRGARNLKKVNKQKLWRAQHRFGMSDNGNNAGSDEEDPSAGVPGGSIYQQQRYNKRGAGGRGNNPGGDLKCFASAKNAGVDPLDDFVDGVFNPSSSTTKVDSIKNEDAAPTLEVLEANSAAGTAGKKKKAPSRDDNVPICTRHQRPCKLLTVKKNNKGNKGRKFYVCSLPRGEQCDFFKWEEDTVEATQRALLKSSSSSGFIARQADAARKRFKELTVPELRIEAKKRGLRATGKKDQILTRLVIWVRDEIANTVEPNAEEEDQSNSQVGSDDEDDTQDSDAESSDDIKAGASKKAASKMIELSDDDDESSYDGDSSDDDEEESGSDDELEICSKVEKPKLTKKKSSTSKSKSTLHDSLESYFGYSEFREGQEWAIKRCLSHERTLLVAPTGQGKSLCYALPAAITEGICLVVSPLISLMQDQLRQLPPKIPAATLSGSMTTAQMALIVDDIMRGRYKVLFVSPERLASAAFRRLVRPKFNVETRQYERQFPVVSLLCVDEAHCLSQWGHNFRPSYLRVKSLIPLIEPKSILALTATAGPMVVRDICNTLCIPFNGRGLDNKGQLLPSPEKPINESSTFDDSNSEGVKVLNCDRDNIDVFSLVLQSNDERRYLLHKILKDKKDGDDKRSKKLPIEEGCLSKGSVIVYVWRQKDTEIVAEQLNGAGIQGGVVCYHGGMDSNDRSRAQSKFLRGKARICVATVAFGLGINKPDIEGVIHLCLPPSPEHYLQEIGRAGRDGRPAKAIALPLEKEFVSRHSLAHSDRSSRDQLDIIFSSLQRLVDEALDDIPPEAGVDLNADKLFIDDIHVAMPVTQTVDASDCKEESIETIFSLLEEESSSSTSYLSVEGYLPDSATITLKKRNLDKLEKYEQIAESITKCGTRVDAQDEQPNSTANNSNNKYQGDFGGTAMEKGFFAYSFGTYKFSIVRCARCMGPNIEPRHVYAALRRLQTNGELELSLDTTANGRALHLKIKQDGMNMFRSRRVNDSSGVQDQENMEISDNVNAIITKLSTQFHAKEKVSVGKVESMYEIMHQVSCQPTNEDDKDMDDEEDVDDSTDHATCQVKKSPRLVVFQKMVQAYFSNAPPPQDNTSTKAPQVIKEFPLHKARPMACLSADVSMLMQVLSTRRQEHMPMAVHINESNFADYRNLCLAKILHSIDAPRAPILQWYSHGLWGKYRNYSFSSVVLAIKKTFDNE